MYMCMTCIFVDRAICQMPCDKRVQGRRVLRKQGSPHAIHRWYLYSIYVYIVIVRLVVYTRVTFCSQIYGLVLSIVRFPSLYNIKTVISLT